MSTMTRPSVKANKKTSAKASLSRAPMPKSAEAPDRGAFSTEAPETRRVQRFEAPDAGEGRASLIEHEFTHGRSQS